METNNLKSYQIRLQCQKCGKFIDVDFYVKLNERDQYGKEEELWPSKLPKYLIVGLDGIFNTINRYKYDIEPPLSMPGYVYGGTLSPKQPTCQPEPFVMCQECINLEKLKE